MAVFRLSVQVYPPKKTFLFKDLFSKCEQIIKRKKVILLESLILRGSCLNWKFYDSASPFRYNLTHFMLLISFYKHTTCFPCWNGVETIATRSFQLRIHAVCLYTPWNHEKTRAVLHFQWGIERDQGYEMGWWTHVVNFFFLD